MSVNVWYDKESNIYNIYYDGKCYQRISYIAAKQLIDDLIINMVAKTKFTKKGN